uniref:BACK domain-containing protein n=1 Tax=Graphocephala atropunctata TaxID=36148 RepID=A0A1B6M184_9HEMI
MCLYRKEQIIVSASTLDKCSDSVRNRLLNCTSDDDMRDVDPNAFKIFLQYVSESKNLGTDWNAQTIFEVCHVANKLSLDNVREQAACHLMPFGVYDLFDGLHCMVKYNATCIEPAVRQIVQEETNLMFDQPQFKSIDVQSLMYILEQDTLSADEPEVCAAVFGWALHQGYVNVDNQEIHLKMLAEHLKNVKLYTFEQVNKVLKPIEILLGHQLDHLKIIPELKTFPESSIFILSTKNRHKPYPLECLYTVLGGKKSTIDARSSSYIFLINKSTRVKRFVFFGRGLESPYDVEVNIVVSKVWAYKFFEKTRFSTKTKVLSNGVIDVDLTDMDFEFRQYNQYRIDVAFDRPQPARTLRGILEQFGGKFGRVQWGSCDIDPNIRDPPTVSYYSHLAKIQFCLSRVEDEREAENNEVIEEEIEEDMFPNNGVIIQQQIFENW